MKARRRTADLDSQSGRFKRAYLNLAEYRLEILVCLALALSVQFVYAQVAGFGFVNFDDDLYLYDNPVVQSGLNWTSIKWAVTTLSLGFWIPATWLSFMAECHLFGLNPGVHHLTNLSLHILNSLLVFLLLRRMTRALWPSALVAALFALHPMRVESVAWVTERKDVLSALFALLAIAAYVAYSERPSWKRFLPVGLFMAIGLMAKPMLVTLPFLLLALDYWPLGRSRLSGLIREKIPLFAIAAVSGALTYLAHYSQGVVRPLEVYPLSLRIANAIISYAIYIMNMFWPRRLAVFYPYDLDPALWQVLGAALLLAAVTTAAIISAKRHPYFISGWIWYVIGLLPVIGLVQAGEQARADRFTYIPLIGLFIIVAWGTSDLIRSRPRARFVASITAMITLPLLATFSWVQASYWRDSETLFTRAILSTSKNHLAHNNLGIALAGQGRIDEAITHYNEALRIKPEYGLAYNNLGNALYRKRMIDEAISSYREALRINPADSKAHNNLGVALADKGLLEAAIEHYRQSLSIYPGNIEAHNNIGNALLRQGKMDEAISYYMSAIEINPDYSPAHFNLGEALARKGEIEKAILHFSKVIEIDPDDREARARIRTLKQPAGR
jgi:tetratricopeptide (TPR) repeat protein